MTSPILALMVLSLASVISAADPNLVGWWRFDGDALDSSGNARHGTLHGAPQFADRVHNESLELDGGDVVTIDGYQGILGPHALSICAWIRTTDNSGNEYNLTIFNYPIFGESKCGHPDSAFRKPVLAPILLASPIPARRF